MKLEPHAPAYPFHDKFEDGSISGHSYGISIRAEIASRIMAGMYTVSENNFHHVEYAREAVKAADALIEELNKPQQCPEKPRRSWPLLSPHGEKARRFNTLQGRQRIGATSTALHSTVTLSGASSPASRGRCSLFTHKANL